MNRHRRSLWSNPLLSLAAAVICGSMIALMSAAGLSGLSHFVLKSMQFIGAFAALSAAVGGYTAGYIYGKYRRSKGLLGGIMCGAALYAVSAAAGIYFFGAPTAITKLILLAAAGAAGGVTGVNSRRPRHLTE